MVTAVRWIYLEVQEDQLANTVWKLTIAGRFKSEKDVTIVTIPRPMAKNPVRVTGQRLYHPGFKHRTHNSLKSALNEFKATKSGYSDLLIEYHLQIEQNPVPEISNIKKLTSEQKIEYLQSSSDIDLSLKTLSGLDKLIKRENNNSTDLVTAIYKSVQKLQKTTNHRFDGIDNVITSNRATTLGRARLMIALCRLNKIPARLVTGFILEERTKNSPYYWVQVYDKDDLTKSYDPENYYENEMPGNYVAFNYNDTRIFTVDNGKILGSYYSLTEELDLPNVVHLNQEKNIFDILDLRRLDLETKQTMIKILLLPFCVLLTAFFRHVLGFFPYGTFTASLLALAMVYAEAVITFIAIGIIFILALLGRSILPKSLARAPRLSLIFTFVAISMVFSISLLSYLSFNLSSSIILVPTIILVSIVDRFYSYMDERGTHAAFLRLGVTVLIAIFCIPILQLDEDASFIITYPEIHLLTAALVLLFSDYKGRKLTDNKYLRLLGENKREKRTRSNDREILPE